jgi:ubiquinone/menaquinone biosynthesis C-methylase UbiE
MKFKESVLAHKYLDNLEGIEIGASAHNPFGLKNCKYVDKYEDMSTDYKKSEIELCGEALKPDIIAEGNQLPFEDSSLDYVITSHVMEHFYDTIGVFKEWIRVVKDGGYIFTIFPHKERTFDKDKDLTTLQELIERHKENVLLASDKHHTIWTTKKAIEFCDYISKELGNIELVEIQDIDDKVGNGFTFIVRVKKP